jgi:hypothetical protein
VKDSLEKRLLELTGLLEDVNAKQEELELSLEKLDKQRHDHELELRRIEAALNAYDAAGVVPKKRGRKPKENEEKIQEIEERNALEEKTEKRNAQSARV